MPATTLIALLAQGAAAGAYLPMPSDYAWPDLWPANYKLNYRGRRPYAPGDLDLPAPSDPSQQRAYLDFPQMKINGGMDPPGHRPEEFRDFGPRGVPGRVGELKLGEADTWKGRATLPIYRMVPYDGRFEVIGEQPVGQFACKQVRFTMSRPARSVSVLALYCQDPGDGRWVQVS
jgi:hypothetical protein